MIPDTLQHLPALQWACIIAAPLVVALGGSLLALVVYLSLTARPHARQRPPVAPTPPLRMEGRTARRERRYSTPAKPYRVKGGPR